MTTQPLKFVPHDYQKVAIDFMLEKGSCGLFLDMGMGKSVATLTAILDLLYNSYEAKKVLIIAPKQVAKSTWPAEIAKWEHTQILRYAMLTGSVKERKENLKKDVEIYITTRDIIRWLVEYLGKDWFFDTVVIDELSNFKSPSSKRFKMMKKIVPLTERIIGLTGTPKPNGYEDLWSQLYLIDGGKRLGKTITAYRNEHFTKRPYLQFPVFDLREGHDKLISDKIKDVCISMKASDYLDLEEAQELDLDVTLDPKERELYRELERNSVLELEDTDITALSAAALTNKLLQFASGAVYKEDKTYEVFHDAKIEMLKELNEQDENLLVFYNFISDKERILKAIPSAATLDDEGAIDKWNAGKIKMLVAHPASCGYGLNLQSGGRIIVWFSLTWNLEHYKQANARLHRQGQKDPVLIYRMVTTGTYDENVADALKRKDVSQENLLESLKARFKEDPETLALLEQKKA